MAALSIRLTKSKNLWHRFELGFAAGNIFPATMGKSFYVSITSSHL